MLVGPMTDRDDSELFWRCQLLLVDSIQDISNGRPRWNHNSGIFNDRLELGYSLASVLNLFTLAKHLISKIIAIRLQSGAINIPTDSYCDDHSRECQVPN